MAFAKSFRIFESLLLVRGRLSLLIGVPSVFLYAGVYALSYNATFFDVLIATTGIAAMLAFLKVTVLLLAYPVIRRARLQGSLFIVVALACGLNLIAMTALAYLGSAGLPELTAPVLCGMLAMAYLFSTIGLWLTLTIMNALFVPRLDDDL